MNDQNADLSRSEIPPNAASRARDRLEPLSWAHDWEAVRTKLAPTFPWEDRRPMMRLSGGADLLLKNMEATRFEGAPHHDRKLIATYGDRIALEAITWSSAPDETEFVIELLSLLEVDEAGWLVGDIIFDGNARADALVECRTRFAAGEGHGYEPTESLFAFGLAFAARDWVAMRRALGDDFVVRDHRSVGLFNLGSADEWTASMRALAELVPDIQAEVCQVLGWDHHGTVFTLHQFGTTADGTPFDRAFINLFWSAGDELRGLELFDVEHADQALTRLQELRPDQS